MTYFMVKRFCLVSPTRSKRSIILQILVQSDTVNDLILFVGHYDPIIHGPVILPYISGPI